MGDDRVNGSVSSSPTAATHFLGDATDGDQGGKLGVSRASLALFPVEDGQCRNADQFGIIIGGQPEALALP